MIEPEDAMAVGVRRRRFTLDEYHRMGEAGILPPDSRVELIEGEIIQMAPIGALHAAVVARVSAFFTDRLRDRATVWPQNPLLMAHHQSEPQPDVILLERRDDFYAGALPAPEDVLLIIEVAESSLRYDRAAKFPLYARAGVGEAWLVDLDQRRIEIHRGPGARRYADVRILAGAERFTALAFPDVAVSSTDLLG